MIVNLPERDEEDRQLKSVACAGCHACCHSFVFLFEDEGDDPSSYETQVVETDRGPWRALKRQANGDCIYLDRSKGCTIYGRCPIVCRTFSCVSLYRYVMTKPRAYRRRLLKELIPRPIFEAGKERA